MQCRRCEFENIPDATHCLKCGAALVVPVDFELTPVRRRAGSLSGQLAHWTRRCGNAFKRDSGFAGEGDGAVQAGAASSVEYAGSAVGAVIASIVPGLGQWHLRRGRLAAAFFCVWLALMVAAIFYPWLLGFAIGVHVLSIVEAYYSKVGASVVVGVWARLGMSLLMFGGLWFFMYWPALGLCGRYATRMIVPAGQILTFVSSWDSWLVAFRRGGEVRRGVIIYYEPRQTSMSLPGNAVLMYGGGTIGYVVGTAGDKVKFQDGGVTVNGEAVDLRWAGHRVQVPTFGGSFTGMEVDVPAGHLFALPLLAQNLRLLVSGEQARTFVDAVCLVSRQEVAGWSWMLLRPQLRRL